MHLGSLLPGRSPRIATTFQPSWATLGSMGIRPDDSKTALRALLRRHALLAAYLDAVNRIDGPNHRRRAPELRLVHRPRRDLPACRVVQFPQRAPRRAGEASPTERPASERFGAKGFLTTDFAPRYEEADMQEGIEAAPASIAMLYAGENQGKLVIKL